MNEELNVGIIGFGLSGRYFFAPFLNANQHFIIKSIVTSQVEEVKQIYPETKVLSSVNELLDDTAIDLVVVASPNFTHFDYARKALLSGKHVIVEKPFTVTSGEADELIAISKERKKILAPFQNRRWDGDFLTVRKLIEENVLGEILEFESHFDRFRPDKERVDWKNEANPGVGALYDLGPHLIDQALSLFGKPDYLFGDIRRQRAIGVNDDYFEIQLFYSGMKVILKASVMCHEVGPRLVVHGRKGSFVKYGLDVQEQNLKDGIKPGDPLLGKDKEELFGLLHIETDNGSVRQHIVTQDGNYMAYFDNVYNAISNGGELAVKPEDGKAIIEIIEKALLSSKEKRFCHF